jgi:hypothetical protein
LLLTVGLSTADILAQVYYALPYTRDDEVDRLLPMTLAET